MIRKKFVILGAGPSGLAFATKLLQLKEDSFLILEKNNVAGGLCRSETVDGCPLDIGGGHFLDVRKEHVLKFLYDFLPENNWSRFSRITKIRTKNFEIDYPYEANIWQLPTEDQIDHLISISKAGCNQGTQKPVKFSEWIPWKLGQVIADNYMLPYNRKIFANVDLDELGTYWLNKLPDVSLRDTLQSCLLKEAHGKIPAHAEFLYPEKLGYGEVFKRIGQSLGSKLILEYPLTSFDVNNLIINQEIQADWIVTTIPWYEYLPIVSNLPAEIEASINKLKYSSIDIVYRNFDEDTQAHWTYYPDDNYPFHRKLFRKNFIRHGKGHWEEINSLRRTKDTNAPTWYNKYAYPLNTTNKPETMKSLLNWAYDNKILALGRWGEWEHMNSDVAIEKGLTLAERIVKNKD